MKAKEQQLTSPEDRRPYACTCAHCTYWCRRLKQSAVRCSRAFNPTTDSDRGLCRIDPPKSDADGFAVWPVTRDLDWCAEFTLKASLSREPLT